jgi:flagellin FlaB
MVKKMEKKYLERLKGTYCKIVAKEPGSEKVSIINGTIENIDTSEGLIIIKSRNGLGFLRLEYIIAIKPKNLITTDKRAMVGIGTLIVFIAMILVAAVAASIIIRTSENLEQKAQSVATQTTREVAAGVVIDDIIGYTNINKTRISYMLLTVRPRAGSNDIDLSSTTLTIKYNNLTLLTLDESLVSMVNTDNKTVFQTPVSPGSTKTIIENTTSNKFGLIVVRDPDQSVITTNGINSGDRVYVVLNLSAIIPEEEGLPKRARISGEIHPELGSPGVFDITSPAVYSRRIIDLW